MKVIFLAAPFTDYFSDQGKMCEADRCRIKALIESVNNLLVSLDCKVQCCHTREKWGEEVWPPERCTIEDYRLIKASDIVVALPGNPPSGGTCIELGWASALGKIIIILLEKDSCYSPLVYGLNSIATAEIICYKNERELLDLLKSKVMSYL